MQKYLSAAIAISAVSIIGPYTFKDVVKSIIGGTITFFSIISLIIGVAYLIIAETKIVRLITINIFDTLMT